MRTRKTPRWLLLFVLLLVACGKEHAVSTDTVVASPPPPPRSRAELPIAHLLAPPRQVRDRTLAYEHTVIVELAVQDIPARIDAMQQACAAQTAGRCEVLFVERRGGDDAGGTVSVRVAPQALERLIQQASDGGDIAERTTRAEDLAEAVADNTLRRTRLEKEHARLLAFQDDPNVKLKDMLLLSERLANVEAQLDIARQEAAQQRRRIDMELLTMRFQPLGVEVGGSAIGDAFRDSLELVGESTARLIRWAASAVPVMVLLAIAWVGWRRRRRPRIGARSGLAAAAQNSP